MFFAQFFFAHPLDMNSSFRPTSNPFSFFFDCFAVKLSTNNCVHPSASHWSVHQNRCVSTLWPLPRPCVAATGPPAPHSSSTRRWTPKCGICSTMLTTYVKCLPVSSKKNRCAPTCSPIRTSIHRSVYPAWRLCLNCPRPRCIHWSAKWSSTKSWWLRWTIQPNRWSCIVRNHLVYKHCPCNCPTRSPTWSMPMSVSLNWNKATISSNAAKSRTS